MNKFYYTVVLFAIMSFLSSCEKEDPIEKQEERIESYIKSAMSSDPEWRYTKDGNVNYLYKPSEDSAIIVSAGDSVFFFYAAAPLSQSSAYFDTNIEEVALSMGITITDPDKFRPLGVRVGHDNLLPGLNIGLLMSHLGDTGEIIFNSDLGYGDKNNGIIPPDSALIFKVFIVGIKKNS